MLGLASRGLAPKGCRLVPSSKIGTLDRCIATSHGLQKLTTGDVGCTRRHVERYRGRRLSEPGLPGIKLDPNHAKLVCKVELRTVAAVIARFALQTGDLPSKS